MVDDAPPPGTYSVKSTFEGENPTIKRNHLTTKFSSQSAREAHTNQYVPNSGEISPKAARLIPGPGTYHYKNMTIGHQTLAFTLKSRIRNTLGKKKFASDITFV